jgi:cbb3-type cytochrome oxidase cytochrome c subunit/predicted nuclease with TOPRIM domain
MSAPKPPPLTKPDRHYNFRAMNIVFAVSSLALLAVTLWMVFVDYAKPWKRLQAQFRAMERQELLTEKEAERQKISEQDLTQMRGDVEAQTARLAEQRDEISKLEADLSDARDKVYEADTRWRTTKSLLDTARYEYGEALQGDDQEHIAEERERVEELNARWRENKVELEGFTEQRDQIQAQIDARRADLATAEERLAALQDGVTSLEQRASVLDKDLDYFVLNAPLMDMLEPTLKIEQVMLPGLIQDINFTKVDRVDRCITCHAAANRGGFAPPAEGDASVDGSNIKAASFENGWPQPFQSHPRLDLFVGDTSPHPYSRFGCTVCHQGLDRATDFARVGHSPNSDEERQEWEQEWGWEAQKFLDTPILPSGTSEAGCISCHSGEVWTPKSEVQDVGRELITKMGCYGCHVMDYPAFTDLRTAGPDLTKIASKTTPEWAYKWIETPRDFRPTTWMPHFFFQQNTQTEENQERQRAEIVALVAYLWDRAEPVESYPAPPSGSADAGQQLFETVGCTGCHIKDREAERDDFFPQINRLHGPNLVRTGSKVDAGWLYAWLKNPKDYWPDTNMPNLRLTDQEAADLAAYILADRDEAYENLELPQVDPAIRDELVVNYLQANYTIEQSAARLEAMDDGARNVYLGERTVAKYGCYGCHNISGFEDTKPIGIELTQEGSKPVHQLDFGHVHEVPHTRHDWIFNKLKQPRVWDRGKEVVKKYDELYKMPNFGMSDREAQAVLTNVLGFVKPNVRPERRAAQGPYADAVAQGRKLVTRFNCQGCHLLEGGGQAIKTVMSRDMLPPNLASEGARVQSDWLFTFLHNPGEQKLRPWLSARMPTFGFSDEQANTLVAYFAALEEREPFASPAGPADPRDLAVGEVVFTMLQCARCHPAGPAATAATGAAAGELAPSLLISHQRLRWDWVPSWIARPQEWIPGTNMPTNFPAGPTGELTSPIEFVFDAPMFAANKQRLRAYFDSDEEMKAYLTDVEKVTAALRDHVWKLGREAG